MAGREPGLRERKKLAARESIARTARGLFAERGFDAVTVADVARAADVSEKTVFNHFPKKADLLFSQREEGRRQMLAAVAGRPAGTSVLDAFRGLTDDMVAALVADDAELAAVPAIIAGSPALQARVAAQWEEDATLLATQLADTAGVDEVEAAVVVRAVLWTHGTVFRAGLAGLAAGEDRAALGRRLRADARRGYDLLAAGLEDVGR